MTYEQAVTYRKEVEAAMLRLQDTIEQSNQRLVDTNAPGYQEFMKFNKELAAAIVHEARALR